jgi:Na+/melibiose symporter-like transporter
VFVLALFLAAALAGVLAPRLSRAFGKKRAAIGVSFTAIVLGPLPIVLRLVGAFPPNGAPSLLWILLVFNLITVTLIIISGILTASMVADIVEDSQVSTGRRSEGVFVAANSFVQKATSGIGIFASTLLLGVIGFPRGAKPGEVDPEVVRMLGLVYAPAIVVFSLIALAFLSTYRISRATHEDNLRRIAASPS